MAVEHVRFEELVDMDGEEVKVVKHAKEVNAGSRKMLAVVDNFGLIRLKAADGNNIPMALAGSFTSLRDAEAAIEHYLSKNPDKAIEPAKKVTRKEVSQDQSFKELTESK